MSGPFGSSQWMYASGGFYNGVATQSLRFDDGSSAYLSRTPASAGNRKTFTFSAWVKRANIGLAHSYLIDVNESGSRENPITLSSDVLRFSMWNGSSDVFSLVTNRLFRDVSSWYHIVVAVDTTQATESNRIKIYINGTQETSFSTETYPSLNSDLDLNSASAHNIGRWVSGTSRYFDGYMSEVNFVDGSQLTPTSFGEFKNGVWIAKRYTGSYGTNGFRLQFNQTGTGTASSSTIGADTSGNDNHFSSSGIVASDCDMPDSPELNWCTLNPLYMSAGTVSEGNLRYDNSAWNQIASTFAFSSGKWYFEVRADSYNSSAEALTVGIREAGKRASATYWHNSSWSNSLDGYVYGVNINGTTEYKITGASSTSLSSNPDIVANSVIGIAIDLDSSTTSIKYNVDGGTLFTLFENMEELTYHPAINGYQAQATVNFGQDSTFAGNETAGGNTDANGNGDFHSAVPSGYLALCSTNLPETTISPNASTQADDYFNTATYSGNSSTQNITSVGFQPDWVWIKSRSNASNHYLTDVVRGTSKGLQTNITNAEVTNTNVITSFNSNGFSLGDDATANVANITGRTYVSWNWKAGGTAVSNTDGTITSSVSANTDAGFSIVSYTGDGTGNFTVGHGLNSALDFVAVKRRDSTSNWYCWHEGLSSGAYVIYLNATNAQASETTVWNSTTPTSSVFTIGTDANLKASGNHVAYCFHSVEGYSKFGSYTGNGSTDGTFVYTGFRPAFVLVKNASVAQSWRIWDTARNTSNETNLYLTPNGNGVEGSTSVSIDILSNGFKPQGSNASMNGSGNTMLYMAFAETPFRYANAR
jgi:hypothetical protein